MKIILVSLFTFITFAQEYKELKSRDVLSRNAISLNREYLYNTFIEIFGNKALSIAKENILTKVSQFGGPCDLYEQVRVEHDKLLKGNKSCFSNKANHKSNINVKSNILRSGYIYKSCKAVVTNKRIMNDFYMKRGILSGLSFDKETLKIIHQSFFPFENLTNKQQEAMKNLYKVSNNSWETVVMAYCLSPDWKII